ncbi:MAG: Fe-S protein assembly chaperone HscA [Bacteroidia bacterium]
MAKFSIDLKSGSLDKGSAVIGIDLGTTNSLIASIDENGEAYCISKDGHNTVPSTIHFGEHIAVGHEAIKEMVTSPENTIYSVKRLMGKSYSDIEDQLKFFNYQLIDEGEDKLIRINVKGKNYSPIELSSIVLKELKKVAENALQEPVSKVVVTVPAYFNDAQRQATRDAGKLAGLDVLRIINEPTAASLAYGIGLNPQDKKTVAVYDLGGGTFDISILRIEQGIFEVLSTNGDTYLGGDDFDQAIVSHWLQEHKISSSSSSDLQLLRLTAERFKKELSQNENVEETLSINGSEYVLSMNRTQLSSLLHPLIERSMECCKLALADAAIKSTEIDDVVMVGGSTRTIAVQNAVAELFHASSIDQDLNPDEVVALGAAIEADILAGNRKDLLLLDVTPLSLGIETMGGLMDVIIPRNGKIPNKVGRQYTTSIDGQVNLKIGVYQGERELVTDNRKLGEFILSGIPAMPAGLPKVEVVFMLDADGILKVSATELRSGVKQEVKLEPKYGLSDSEVENMLLASLKNASSDMELRALTEAITEANQLLYSMNKFKKDHADLLDDQSVEQIRSKMRDIDTAIQTKNKDQIVNSCEELNNYSKQFAEKAMDKTISKALKGKKI